MSTKPVVTVRRPEKDDLEHVSKWMTDPDFLFFLYGDPTQSPKQIRDQVLSRFGSEQSVYDSNIHLIIESRDEGPIGLITFHSISWKSRHAMIEVYLVAAKRNRIHGAIALYKAMDYAFTELNMHRVGAYIYEFNKRSMRMAERSGAKREQTLRRHTYRDGRYWDMYGYGLLRDEFEQTKERFEKSFIGRALDEEASP